MDLTGKTGIVTGGAVRIGKAIALALARAGVDVCIQYRTSNDEAEATLTELRQSGIHATAVQADFCEPLSAAKKIMEHVTTHHGGAEFLINSAAIFEPGTLTSTREENWDRHFDINLKSPVFLTQEFVRQGRGEAVVNLVDWRGTRPVAGHLAYTLTKAALVAETKILAQELGPKIRVNAVAPGAILPAPGAPAAEFEQRGQLNPLQRVGSPELVADAVLFTLTSDFLTGEIIHITGGEQL